MKRRYLSSILSLTALAAAAVALTTTAVGPVRAADNADPETLYNQANERLGANDYDGAITLFNQAVKIQKRFPDAFFFRGTAWEHKKDLDKAIADFTTVITQKPKLADAYLERGRCYAAKSDLTDALPDFSKVLQLRPSETDVYLARGDAYLNTKQYGPAISDYTTYIQKAQGIDRSVWFNRATAEYANKSYDPAISDLEHYLQTLPPNDPTTGEAYQFRADAYMGKKDYHAAIGDYSKVLALKPNDPYALGQRALAYLDDKDGPHAIADYDALLKLQPNNTVALQNKLVAQQMTPGEGGSQATIETATQLLTVNPTNVDARGTRAYQYFKTGNYTGAISDYSAILQVKPNDSTALFNRAVSYSKTGQDQAALADFSTYLAAKPDDAAALEGRGTIYAKENKWDLAAQDFGTVARTKPDDLDAQKNYGLALFATGDKTKYEESYRVLTDYDQKKPGDKEVTAELGALAVATGKADVAIARLKAAIEADPKNSSAMFNLGVAYDAAKQYNNAADAYTKALVVKPDYTDALRNRAATYFNLGKSLTPSDNKSAPPPDAVAAFDKSIADATTLVTQNPSDATFVLLRADSNFAAHKYTEAGADYEKYLGMKPGDKYASGQMVASYVNAKDYPHVISATTAAIGAAPDNPDNYRYRSIAYLESKDYANAIADLSKYVTLKPDDAAAYYDLGAAYEGKGDNVSAAASFEKAATVKPDYYEAAIHGGQDYKKMGDADQADTNKANPEYDKAIALFGKAAEARGTGAEAATATYNQANAIEAKAKANDNDVPTLKQAVEAWQKWLTLAPNDPETAKIQAHIAALQKQIANGG